MVFRFWPSTLFLVGALVGEGGALGIANKRSTKIGAWKAGFSLSHTALQLEAWCCRAWRKHHEIHTLHHSTKPEGWNGSSHPIARLIHWKGFVSEKLLLEIHLLVVLLGYVLFFSCCLITVTTKAVQRCPEDCKALELQFQQRFLALLAEFTFHTAFTCFHHPCNMLPIIFEMHTIIAVKMTAASTL